MQMEALECGAACLTMVLAYYGRWEPLEKIRAECGVSRDGSKASNIMKAARRYGLSAQGKSYSLEGIKNGPTFPCIIFWNFNHFVVLDGFKRNCAVINDPARGVVKVPMDEFRESFTGVTIKIDKTDAFEPGGQPPNPLSFAMSRLKGMGPAIAFVMLTAAITSLVSIVNMSLGKVFIDHVLGGSNPEWLLPLTLLMVLLALVSGYVSIANAVYLTRIQGKIAVVSSSRFMRHLLHLPVGFYSQRMVGDLQQRQNSNETIAFDLVGQLAPVLVNACMLVLYLVIMLHYSALLTCVGIAAAAINMALGSYISKKRVNIARASTVAMGKLYATTVGGVEMIETIKTSGAELGYFARWAGFQAAANEGHANTTRLNTYFGMLPLITSEVANIAVLGLGIWLIVNGGFTAGALMAFQGFLSSFMAPVQQIIGLSQTIQEMQTNMERVEDVMSYPVDVPEEPTSREGLETTGQAKLRGTVDLKGVTFGYSPMAPPLIENFDMHLKPGQWVALVGGSGCGKSTIAKLVSGLYQPWSGEIHFDGTPIADIPRNLLRGSLAVVDQDIVTFDDSVIDNLRLWDKSIEDFEVFLACRDADIHDVVAKREGGYGARMLSDGRNFSGGQLQRLEIARVLAQDPTIIILDEATSALDAQTEAEVIRHIRDRDITCIVIAHRLSTIRDCDEIIVLDGGKVVERGTHEELLAKGDAYAELVRSD